MECIRCGKPVERELVFPFAQCQSCAEEEAEREEDEKRTKALIKNYWGAHPFWQDNALRIARKPKVVWRKRY